MKQIILVTMLMVFVTSVFAQSNSALESCVNKIDQDINKKIPTQNCNKQSHLRLFESGAGNFKLQGATTKEAVVLWDECEGLLGISGNLVLDQRGVEKDYACDTKRPMAKVFFDYLNTNLTNCISIAHKKASGSSEPITKIHFRHAGTVADEFHSTKSLHAVGRAIDIRSIQLQTAKEKVNYYYPEAAGVYLTNISKAKKKAEPTAVNKMIYTFYEEFRNCWTDSLEKQTQCVVGGNGIRGTTGWENVKHRHHLHLAMPYCPKDKGMSRE